MSTLSRLALVLCLTLALAALAAAAPVPEPRGAGASLSPPAPADGTGRNALPLDLAGAQHPVNRDSSLAVCCEQVCSNFCDGNAHVVSCRPRTFPPGGCLAICSSC